MSFKILLTKLKLRGSSEWQRFFLAGMESWNCRLLTKASKQINQTQGFRTQSKTKLYSEKLNKTFERNWPVFQPNHHPRPILPNDLIIPQIHNLILWRIHWLTHSRINANHWKHNSLKHLLSHLPFTTKLRNWKTK